MLDLNRPRSIAGLFETAAKLYGRYPLQFIFVAACVVVPFEVLVELFTSATPGGGNASRETTLLLGLISVVLIGPLVSAVQVQALFAVSEGDHPRPDIVFERALRVLPTVVAAQIIAAIGIFVGFWILLIPGIYLTLRFAVAAQVAAAEGVDWMGALRRSGELARFNYWRIAGVVVLVDVIGLLIADLAGSAIGNSNRIGPVAIEMPCWCWFSRSARSSQRCSISTSTPVRAPSRVGRSSIVEPRRLMYQSDTSNADEAHDLFAA